MKRIIPVTFPLLAAVLLLDLVPTKLNTPPPESAQLVRYYTTQLDSRFYGDRMDGITGLGHLGRKASHAVSRLIEKSKNKQNTFYRLLALWSLAEIGTSQALGQSRSQANSERQRLLDGRFPEVAARTALLATTDRSNTMMHKLNNSLPALYNKARSGDLTEKLIASWSLYQVGTPVTEQTANHALKKTAQVLTPDHANYTRHLRYIRLVGAPGYQFFANKLRTLLRTYDFAMGVTPKRALTAYTLAVIAYPGEDPTVTAFKKDINNRLDSVLDRGSALDDLVALGPFGCSQGVAGKLQEISNESSDESDVENASRMLSVCQ